MKFWDHWQKTTRVALIALCCWFLSPTDTFAQTKLFGTLEFKGKSLDALPQWQRILGEFEKQRAIFAACDAADTGCPSPRIKAWRGVLKALKGKPLPEQMAKVTAFANSWPYKYDMDNWGKEDYWASPNEFIEKAGDCEDYAIMKYLSLRDLGVSPDHLRIVVVRDRVRQIAHAVLAVYVDQQIFILDNFNDKALPQESVQQYVPQFSINETTRWAHVPAKKPGG